MPDTIIIETAALTALLNRVTALDDNATFQKIGLKAATRAGLVAEQVVGEYPPQRRATMKQVRGKTFLTDKQRRYFFWALAKGEIKVPYRRTGRTGQGITSAPFARGDVVGFFIGTNSPGAVYVLGTPRQGQAMYHQDWWTPLAWSVRDNKDLIVGEFERTFIEETNRFLRSGVA
jgi:hypothetical protein